MKSKKPKKPIWYRFLRWLILWTVLPIILFYAVIAIWHPEQNAISSAFRKIETDTGIKITYSNVRITATGGIEFSDMVIRRPPDFIFHSKKLVFTVSIAPLVRGRVGLKANGTAYSGKFTVLFDAPILNKGNPVNIQPEWDHLNLGEMKKDFNQISLDKGLTSGNADLLLKPEDPKYLRGTSEIKLTDISILLPEQAGGMLGFSEISNIDGKLQFHDNETRLTEVWSQIPEVGSLRLTGTITRIEDSTISMLDLELRVYFHKKDEPIDKKKYLPITITGPSVKPEIKFLGSTINLDELKKLF